MNQHDSALLTWEEVAVAGTIGTDCSPENLPPGPLVRQRTRQRRITAALEGAPAVTPRVRWALSSGPVCLRLSLESDQRPAESPRLEFSAFLTSEELALRCRRVWAPGSPSGLNPGSRVALGKF